MTLHGFHRAVTHTPLHVRIQDTQAYLGSGTGSSRGCLSAEQLRSLWSAQAAMRRRCSCGGGPESALTPLSTNFGTLQSSLVNNRLFVVRTHTPAHRTPPWRTTLHYTPEVFRRHRSALTCFFFLIILAVLPRASEWILRHFLMQNTWGHVASRPTSKDSQCESFCIYLSLRNCTSRAFLFIFFFLRK